MNVLVADRQLPIIAFFSIDDRDTVRAALGAGARGYISKNSAMSHLITAVRVVADGGIFLPPESGNESGPELGKSLSSVGLNVTKRQIEVLSRIAQGKSTQRIAKDLNIAENAVKHHISAIYRALGAATRSEATMAAVRLELLR